MAGDFIRVPPPQAFFEPINWHRTVLHELGHHSGPRLGRDMSGAFGSQKYVYEELVAEICSAYVCAALAIVPTVRHADYIGAWIELLTEQDRAIVRAASAASKAADYLLAFRDRPAGAAQQEARRRQAREDRGVRPDLHPSFQARSPLFQPPQRERREGAS